MSSRGQMSSFYARRTRATLDEVERQIRSHSTERTYVYDKYGNEVYAKVGTNDSTALPTSEAKNFAGGTLTHNHPAGTSFSQADVAFAQDAKLGEMRAVGSGYRYSLRPPKGGWQNLNTEWYPSLEKGYEQASRFAANRIRQQYSSGRLTREAAEQAMRDVNHEVMKSLAETMGVVYRRTRWKR